MNRLWSFLCSLLRVRPARDRSIVINESLTWTQTVLRSKLWYRGDPAELEQFFRQTAGTDIEKARFWAAAPQGRVRKMHSGLPATVIDRYRDIILGDFLGVSFGSGPRGSEAAARWDAIGRDCRFGELVGQAVTGALSAGDGAFRITVDEGDKGPMVTFFEADRVEYVRRGGRLAETRFYTIYESGGRPYRLEERYGEGYVDYRLYDRDGRAVALDTLAETRRLRPVTFPGGFSMAVPLMFFGSAKWPGRGKALFDDKTDALDALDEVMSQWLDAVRMGRVKRYIPEDLLPRNPETGMALPPNPFDNSFIAVGSNRAEGAADRIEISQPLIGWEAYMNTYAAFLELALQGIISPATLGVDLKKTDNAEAQREKEKITLFVRGKMVDTLSDVLPRVVETMLRVDDVMHGRPAGTYEASVRFGEYASPGFDSTVDTVVKAMQGGVMSIEQAVEELYGDTWTLAQKTEEINRLRGNRKNDQGGK